MATPQFKPQFFVTRQNGAMVPLIAMDELPIHVQIQGVSRTLSAFEVAGMTGVGTVDARHQFYVVESMNNTKPIFFMSSNPNSTANSATSTPILTPTYLASPIPRKLSITNVNPIVDTSSGSSPSSNTSIGDEAKSSRATSPETVPGPTPEVKAPTATVPTPLEWRTNTASTPVAVTNTAFTDKSCPEVDWNPDMPPSGQKIYCAFWLKNGECSFTQTGCLFKHVMPLKLEVLEALGLRDLPDWFRKTVQCGSLRVNGGRNGLSFGITPQNVGPVVNAAGPRARLNPEASRRAIATHINAMPIHRSPPAGPRQVRTANSRPAVLGSPRASHVQTEAEKAEERERRNQCLSKAFEADLVSNACSDMMDAEQERLQRKEQAGWDMEVKTCQAGIAIQAIKAEKNIEASGSEKTGNERGKSVAGKKHTVAGTRRRSPPLRKALK